MFETLGRVTLPRLDLVSGKTLEPVEQVYARYGDPLPDGSNVIVVCHALTGSHHLAGGDVPGLPPGWWDTMVGPRKAFDTDRMCVICFNNLCSPYGSSSPCAIDARTEKPWGMNFPVVSPRDVAQAQRLALEQLGIERVGAVVGASLGGMIALEWALSFPEIVSRLIVIAAPCRLFPQAIAFNEVQRRSIQSDPEWCGGDYYPGVGPSQGLAVARMLAMITYRSEQSFAGRYMRDLAKGSAHEWGGQFQIESYLHHHGEEIVKRFDANCYLYLTRMMDLHDVSAERGSLEEAFKRFAGRRLLAVGISSDLLFPNWQVEEVAKIASAQGVGAHYEEIESENGHDSFLIDFGQLDDILRDFLKNSGL